MRVKEQLNYLFKFHLANESVLGFFNSVREDIFVH